jgi:hypothetical protein
MPKSVIFTRPFLSQDVLGLDVAVDDAFVVGELECFADLRDYLQRLLGREPARLLDLPQIRAVHELHHQIRLAGRLPEIMHGHNVRVIQPGQRAGLPIEPLGKTGIVRRAAESSAPPTGRVPAAAPYRPRPFRPCRSVQ